MHLQLLDKMVPACETLLRLSPHTIGLIRVPVICDAFRSPGIALSPAVNATGHGWGDERRLRRFYTGGWVCFELFRNVITRGGEVGWRVYVVYFIRIVDDSDRVWRIEVSVPLFKFLEKDATVSYGGKLSIWLEYLSWRGIIMHLQFK